MNNGTWNQNYSNPRSNKLYVTGLDEAVNRIAPRDSEMVYFNQDKNEFYVIKTDYDGRKSWATFTYDIPNQDANIPASRADFKSLLERIEKLEKGIKSEVTSNAESNG